MAQELVRLGANVNAASLSGNTALHTASGRGMGQITRILLSAGADVTVHNSQHDSAVTVANSKEVRMQFGIIQTRAWLEMGNRVSASVGLRVLVPLILSNHPEPYRKP